FRTGKEIEGLRGGVLGYRLAERRDRRSSPPKPLRPPPKAVAKSAGGPTALGGKGPFPDGN
ncbi:MAG: hypothetical protein ACLP51_06190, partial [Syntrophobacteraceae bacterium]